MQDKLTRYFLGELDHFEREELFDVLKTDESLKSEFVKLQNLHGLSHLSVLSMDEGEGKREFQNFLKRMNVKRQRRLVQNIFKYAAVAILLIASTFFATKIIYESTSGEWNTLYVPAGQRAELTLQDGSVVWLNARSTLKYPARFTGKTRSVEIIGEGYFDIAKNEKKPFIVSSQNVEMKVLGTQFNVYSYPETGYIKTDLVEGSLKVYPKSHEQEGVILKPSQQVTIKDEKMQLGESAYSDYFLWKDGIYAFENERLLDILEKLQLYYDVQIIVEDPGIFETCYTGKFRQRDGIDEILRIIQKIRPFKIKKDTEKNVITLLK